MFPPPQGEVDPDPEGSGDGGGNTCGNPPLDAAEARKPDTRRGTISNVAQLRGVPDAERRALRARRSRIDVSE